MCIGTLHLEGKSGEECELETLWLHVIEEASELAEALRYGSIEGIEYNIVGVFAWFGAFLQRIKDHHFGRPTFKKILEQRLIDISTVIIGEMTENLKEKIRNQVEENYADLIILLKYPHCCPFCERKEHCNCLGMSEDEYKKKKEELENVEVRAAIMKNSEAIEISAGTPKFVLPEKGIRGWKDMFKRIYGRQIRSQTLEQVGFHLMEEIGEVARALRKVKEAVRKAEKAKEVREKEAREEEIYKEVANLQDELADTFDWIIAMILKIEALLGREFMISMLMTHHSTYRKDFLDILLPKSPKERQKQVI